MSAVAARVALAAVLAGAALSIIALQPSIVVAHDALIVNTTITSSIMDARGYAVSIVPAGLSCGVDSTVWCEVADWSAAS